jgi:hypothetical protein
MAENLAWLPSVNPSADGSEAAPYYDVYGFESADAESASNQSNSVVYDDMTVRG